MSVNWAQVQKEYENTTRSLRDLAADFNTSHTQIGKKAKELGWQLRSKVSKKAAGNGNDKDDYKDIIGKVAMRKMHELIKELGNQYSSVDEPLIVMYARNYEQWIELEKEIAKHGVTAKSPKGGLYLHPTFNASLALQKTLVTIANQLGLSIASRKRLGMVIGEEKKEGNLFDFLDAFSGDDDQLMMIGGDLDV